tara:strand:- start:5794 stop:6075 length:282 start_codon:yes stop_codon:yes gene_type:complete
MSKIPQVKSAILHSLNKGLDDMEKDKDLKEAYLATFWEGLSMDQPALTEMILKEITAFKKTGEMGAFAHGCWLVYRALESQQQADEFNEVWGS